MKIIDREDLPQYDREEASKALAECPLEKANVARFFGIELLEYDKDELMQMVMWISKNARPHRHDH